MRMGGVVVGAAGEVCIEDAGGAVRMEVGEEALRLQVVVARAAVVTHHEVTATIITECRHR